VAQHDVGHNAEGRWRRGGAAGEGGAEIGEEPRPAQATPSDDHPVAAGLGHHADGVGGFPDVAVAQYGDCGHGRLELGDGRPGGVSGVALLGRAGVEGDGGGALRFGDLPGGDGGEEPVVDASAELDGDRDAVGGGGFHRRGDDVGQQPAADGQGGAAAFGGDLGRRAAEIEVDVLDAEVADEPAGGLADRAGGHAVELGAAGPLVGVEAEHAGGAVVPFDQRPGGQHLADVEPARPEPAAQPPERPGGDPGHRRQHDRRVEPQRPDPQGHAHRSITVRPTCPRSWRKSGRESPITFP
jgi:hypothetical protein